MGKVIVRELAEQGATVALVCRSVGSGEETRAEIAAATGSATLDVLVGDLSSQQDIRRVAEQFRSRYGQLHVLVNNAGAHVQTRQVSVDGVEMNLAVNHLSAFLLNNLLVEMMRASAPARIVNVASDSMTKTIALDDLQSERRFTPFAVYGQAKLAMVMCTYALARRLAGTGVTVNAPHPGITATGIINDVAPPLARPFTGIIKRFLQSPERGAQTALYLAMAPEVATVSGAYFANKRQKRSVPLSYDEAMQERVWSASAELVGLEDLEYGVALGV